MKNNVFKIRIRKNPSNPRTTYQQNGRAIFAHVSRQWADLTDEQREIWNEYAKTISYRKKGRYFTFKGFTLFIKLNRELLNIGRPIYKDIEPWNFVNPPSINDTMIDVILKPGEEDIRLKLPIDLDDVTTVIVYGSPALKASRQIDWKKLRVITTIDYKFRGEISIRDKYMERFKCMPEVGDKVAFAVKSVNNVCGLTSGKVLIVPRIEN